MPANPKTAQGMTGIGEREPSDLLSRVHTWLMFWAWEAKAMETHGAHVYFDAAGQVWPLLVAQMENREVQLLRRGRRVMSHIKLIARWAVMGFVTTCSLIAILDPAVSYDRLFLVGVVASVMARGAWWATE